MILELEDALRFKKAGAARGTTGLVPSNCSCIGYVEGEGAVRASAGARPREEPWLPLSRGDVASQRFFPKGGACDHRGGEVVICTAGVSIAKGVNIFIRYYITGGRAAQFSRNRRGPPRRWSTSVGRIGHWRRRGGPRCSVEARGPCGATGAKHILFVYIRREAEDEADNPGRIFSGFPVTGAAIPPRRL